jgi:hypothetical protein
MIAMARMLTTTEVGKMADPPVSRFTVEREIHRENLDAEKVGGRWLVEHDEAKRWAAEFMRWRTQRGPRRP